MFVVSVSKNEDVEGEESGEKIKISGSQASIDVFCAISMEKDKPSVLVRTGCGNEYMDDNGITTIYNFASTNECLNGFIHLVRLWKTKINSSSMSSMISPEIRALIDDDEQNFDLTPSSIGIIEKTSSSFFKYDDDIVNGDDDEEEGDADDDEQKPKKAKKVTAKWETTLAKQLKQIKSSKKEFNHTPRKFYENVVDECSMFSDIINELSPWHDYDNKKILSLEDGQQKYNGINVYNAKCDFMTLLHLMIMGDHNNDVQKLIENGADLNAYTYSSHDSMGDGWGEMQFNLMTPLHIACANGNLEAATLLLKHGASVHLPSGMHGSFPPPIKDSDYFYADKCTALHIAAEGGHNDIIELLLDGPKPKAEYDNTYKVDVNEYFYHTYGHIVQNTNMKHLKRVLISLQNILSNSKSKFKKTGTIAAFQSAIGELLETVNEGFVMTLTSIHNEKMNIQSLFETMKQNKKSLSNQDNEDNDDADMDCDDDDDLGTAEQTPEYVELVEVEALISNFQLSIITPFEKFKDYIGTRTKAGAYDECMKFLNTLIFTVSEFQSYSKCTEEDSEKINNLLGKEHSWNITDINALGGNVELSCDDSYEDIKCNALCYALMYGHLSTAKLLLSRGANLDNVGEKGGLGRKRLSEFIQELLDNN
jgi:ankyrin repeat protein